MKRSILSMGIILLFILSAIAPISFGFDINYSKKSNIDKEHRNSRLFFNKYNNENSFDGYTLYATWLSKKKPT